MYVLYKKKDSFSVYLPYHITLEFILFMDGNNNY